jgi:L-ascorbate metabolism protein UlaG (beta-lactamase superfamily)
VTVRHDDLGLRWLGYATARLATADDATVVYTDPGRYGVLTGGWEPPAGAGDAHPHPSGPAYDARDGDLVVVTHDHHYDPDGIRRVAREGATLVVYEGVDADRAGRPPGPETLAAEAGYDLVRVGESETTTAAGVAVTSLPAYNDPDGPHVRGSGEPYHPRGFGVGYHLVVGDTPVLWTGDSDHVPEQEGVDVSLLLATICGSVAMDAAGAADLAAALDPDLVCPIHYDTFDLLAADARSFAGEVAGRGVPVVLDPGWS